MPGSGSLASAWLANVCHSACPVMLAVTNLSGNFLFIGHEPEIINTQLIMSVSTTGLLHILLHLVIKHSTRASRCLFVGYLTLEKRSAGRSRSQTKIAVQSSHQATSIQQCNNNADNTKENSISWPFILCKTILVSVSYWCIHILGLS